MHRKKTLKLLEMHIFLLFLFSNAWIFNFCAYICNREISPKLS